MNKKLKIIQLIDSLKAGGSEMMAVNIANGLADNGIESYLCTTRLEGNLKNLLKKEVNYIYLNKKHTVDFKSILQLKRFIKREKITIIHAHSSSFFLASLVKLLSPNLKVIWHDHYGDSENLEKRNKHILMLLSYTFNAIISVNKGLQGWAKKYLKTKKTYLISNFVTFNEDIKKSTILKGEENKRVVCIANLRIQKNHLNLLKAFEVVVKNYPSWTLHIVGLDFKDDYSAKINSFISEHKLTEQVFLYGSCQDIKFILAQSTIGVLSSRSEGLPLSLLEYGLAKLPVVVTDVGDCASVVENGKSGIIVKSNDYKALANGIIAFINNPTKKKSSGFKLNKTVEEKYSQNAVINLIINSYKKC